MFEREARQNTVKQLRLAAFVLPVMLAAAMAVPVRSAMAQYDNGDSQPGAARASLIQGSVSMQRGDNGEWDSLTPNTPLFTGDSVSTGPGSRTEIQLDFANVIRLSDGADARIANLSPSQVQVQVGDGEVSYSE